MNILIVHDRSDIGEEIRAIVAGICPTSKTDLVTDASSARARLGSEFYDLLILDLTIPNMSPKVADGFQVAEGLLEELMGSPAMLTPGGTLGITRDVDALNSVQNNIGPHLMAIVEEDIDGQWRRQLEDRVKYALSSSSARATALLTKHDFDLLIVTALDKELSPFRDLFELQEYPAITGVSEFAFTDKDGVPRRGACYAIGRAGQPSAASETQGLLCLLRPKFAIMTGFCGGVPKKADLGDILLAEAAIDWDYGKWKPSESVARLYSRPEPVGIRNSSAHRLAREIVEHGLAGQQSLVAEMMRLSKGEIKEPKIRLTPFASGSAVIGDPAVLESIKALNENVGGVDMESFGFYFACKYARAVAPEFICIKAVADDCGPEKDDRLHPACCYASAHIAHHIATRLWDFS